MYELNNKIKDLVPYQPIKGEYKIRLDANESFLRVPSYVMAEVIRKSGVLQFNRYPDAMAAELCNSFAASYGVNPDNIVAGNGSDELISVIFGGFLMKGERYASLSQDFSMYDFYGAICEAENVKIQKNSNFTIDVQMVIDTCNAQKVRLLIFSNPCNPTSIGLSQDDVRRIIKETSCLVVLDEAYMDFWDQSLLDEVNDYDNLLILKTCSKAFGLAALRVGFAVGNTTLIRAIKAIKSPYNVNSVSQITASVILKHRGECKAALSQIKQSRDELYDMLCALNKKYGDLMTIPKTCTNFVVLRTDMAEDIYNYLLHLGIAVRFFGDFLRITAGSNNENVQLLKFLEKYFEEKLKP